MSKRESGVTPLPRPSKCLRVCAAGCHGCWSQLGTPKPVKHTILLGGSQFRTPPGGFMPSRMAGDLIAKDQATQTERRVSYTESVGLLPFVPLQVVGGLLHTGSQPFAEEVRKDLFLRFRLGSMLHSRVNLSAAVTIHLPVGYTVRSVGAPVDLVTLTRRTSGAVAENLQLTAGSWLCSTRSCTFTLLPSDGAVIYSSFIVVHFLVDNPTSPLKVNFAANRWQINISGPGDADHVLSISKQTLQPAEVNSEVKLAASTVVLGRITLASLIPTNLWQGAFRSLARVFFRSQQGWAGLVAVQMVVPKSFGLDDPCVVQDLPEEYYRARQGLIGPSTSMEQEVASLQVHRLPRVTHCLGRRVSSFPSTPVTQSMDTLLPCMAEIYTTGPILEATMYGFAIFLRYTAMAVEGGGFHLATQIRSEEGLWEMLDSSGSTSLPLMTHAINTAQLFAEGAQKADVMVANMLPFALTGKPAETRLLLRPPVVNPQAWQKVTWRVFAPHTYVWDFEEYNFYFRHSQVPGSDMDLPIARIPPMPRSHPLNLLVFEGTDEAAPGWLPLATYGFRAGVQVPTQTPRHSVNEWVVEWGSGDLTLRRAAATAQGTEVRAIHSFQVWCMGSSVQGQDSEILLEFGTETEVPVGGALKLLMPAGFLPEHWHLATTERPRCEPFQLMVPIEVSVDNVSSQLLLQPRESLQRGLWCLLLAGPLPTEVTPPDATTSFRLETVDGDQETADLAATTDGFPVRSALAFADLVHDVNYSLTGREDHPSQASRLIFAFELQKRPRVIGKLQIEVLAPRDFTFHDTCDVQIGIDIFGASGFPRPLVPFEVGIHLLSCVGSRNRARMEVSPGLHAGRRYAFSLRVDAQPETTPQVRNHWFLTVADEATMTPIPGFTLWSFLDLALAMLVQTIDSDTEVIILFRPTNTISSKDRLELQAPQGFRVPRHCRAQVQQLSLGASFQRRELDLDLPGVQCMGQQPPNHFFQVRTAAVLARGVRYRLTVGARSPVMASSTGSTHSWLLRSFRQDGQLLDIGSVASPSLTPAFSLFEVLFVEVEDSNVAVQMHVELPQEAQPMEVLTITAPETFNFQDMNTTSECLVQDLPLQLPQPTCEGAQIRFNFSSLTMGRFDFALRSTWPTVSLKGTDAFIGHLEQANGVILATGRAPLQRAFAPRFANFSLQRSSNIWAQALSSTGNIYITFEPRQRAEVIELSSRLGTTSLGINLLTATVQVITGQEFQVFHVPEKTQRLLLAGQFEPAERVTLLLINTINPEVIGSMTWTLRSFSRPLLSGSLVTAAQAAEGFQAAAMAAGQVANLSGEVLPRPAPTLEEIQQWLDWETRSRDEIADYRATTVYGLLVLMSTYLEGNFFDFKGSEVSFEMSLRPGKAEVGHRFLIFAPENWTFVPGSFQSQGFETQDLGILDCLQQLPAVNEPPRLVSVYALRLLDEGLSKMIPCRFNEAAQCENSVRFSFRADTPATPNRTEWQDVGQAWLVQVDAHTGTACGPHPAELDSTLLRFTNDALFRGFALKESLGVRVVPQHGHNVPRKATFVTVFFQCRSPLVAQGALLLRVEAPLGVEFDRGCLANPVDPNYMGCAGLGRIAVAQRQEVSLVPGEHELSLRAINPARTVEENWWTLSAYVDVPLTTAQQGAVESLRQRGRGDGYDLSQQLQARVRPSSQQASGPVRIFLWLRPQVEVVAGGHVELHAAQGFEMSCQPALVLLAIPPGSCNAYHVTSGLEYVDDHDVIDFTVSQGYSLLPNHEYELSVSSRNPATIYGSSGWGVLIRDEVRQVLEANMEIPSYELTDFGFELLSLQPSTPAPNASNEVRLQLRFQRPLPLGQPINEIRIEAPEAWDFQPFCNLYQDINGVCETRCSFQLPYAEERGHHLCEGNVLILVLDDFGVIDVTAFVVLFSVVNPAEAPSQNLWSVSLANSFDPQHVKFTELLTPGFFIGDRQTVLPALPVEE